MKLIESERLYLREFEFTDVERLSAYLLSKEYLGQGFATEISAAVLEYGFKKLGLKKIVALAYPDNFSSINVIRKLGMQPDGEKIFFEKSLLFFSARSPTEFKNNN